MKKYIFEEEEKPSGDGWKKVQNLTYIEQNLDKFVLSPGKEWFRNKSSSSSNNTRTV